MASRSFQGEISKNGFIRGSTTEWDDASWQVRFSVQTKQCHRGTLGMPGMYFEDIADRQLFQSGAVQFCTIIIDHTWIKVCVGLDL